MASQARKRRPSQVQLRSGQRQRDLYRPQPRNEITSRYINNDTYFKQRKELEASGGSSIKSSDQLEYEKKEIQPVLINNCKDINGLMLASKTQRNCADFGDFGDEAGPEKLLLSSPVMEVSAVSANFERRGSRDSRSSRSRSGSEAQRRLSTISGIENRANSSGSGQVSRGSYGSNNSRGSRGSRGSTEIQKDISRSHSDSYLGSINTSVSYSDSRVKGLLNGKKNSSSPGHKTHRKQYSIELNGDSPVNSGLIFNENWMVSGHHKQSSNGDNYHGQRPWSAPEESRSPLCPKSKEKSFR